jgi:hypothetical protein
LVSAWRIRIGMCNGIRSFPLKEVNTVEAAH